MQTHDLFDVASDIERAKLRRLTYTITGCAEYFNPMPTLCPFDGVIIDPAKGYTILEAKIRYHRHDRFDSALIEYPKYAQLMEFVHRHHLADRAWYVNFYSDGFARVYNLDRWEPEWNSKSLNKTVMGSNESVDKLVGYIDHEFGRLIECK